MKLSIRMKIFLPVMFLLIAFPVAAWFVFSYALDGHMNYNAKRDLGQMVKRFSGRDAIGYSFPL